MTEGFGVLGELFLFAATPDGHIINVLALILLGHEHRPLHIPSLLACFSLQAVRSFLRCCLCEPVFPLFCLHLPGVEALGNLRNNLGVSERGHKEVEKAAVEDEEAANVSKKGEELIGLSVSHFTHITDVYLDGEELVVRGIGSPR